MEFEDSDYEEDLYQSMVTSRINWNWKFDPRVKELPEILDLDLLGPQETEKFPNSKSVTLSEIQGSNYKLMRDSFILPLYMISTRDSFAYDLIEKVTILNIRGRKVIKKGLNNSYIYQMLYCNLK